MSAVEKRLTRGLRLLREDLWSAKPHPLPPSARLRRLPHGLVVLVAGLTMLGNLDEMGETYQLGAQYGLLCSLAQAAAVVLALWWPVPAWWASTVVTTVVALGVRARLFTEQTVRDSRSVHPEVTDGLTTPFPRARSTPTCPGHGARWG